VKSTKCLLCFLCVVLSFAIHARPRSAVAAVVEWRLQDGGNGHRYEDVSAPSGISWALAQVEASKRGGYLATITSSAENTFLFNAIDSSPNWLSGDSRYYGPWLGGFQSASGTEPAGGWNWVTGEPFSYNNWASEEPNNQGGAEDYLHFFAFNSRASTWNDATAVASMNGYIVEYDPPVQPSQLVVPGTANPYRADRANTPGTDPLDGTTPPSIAVAPGEVLRFTATGQTRHGPTEPYTPSPDGGQLAAAAYGAVGSISSWNLPIDSLVGVFTGPAMGTPPSPSNVGTSFSSLSPELGQVFFVGDGLTGTHSGAQQLFEVPTGAAQLYLANLDGYEWGNNSGAFSVKVDPLLRNAAPAPVAPQAPQNLVLVTHGWRGLAPDGNPTSSGWVAQTTAALAASMHAQGNSDWMVVGYDWQLDSDTNTPFQALQNALAVGVSAGIDIVRGNYSHVHLVGHSAGAALITTAAQQLQLQSPTTTLHYTYLDPYTPDEISTLYGAHRGQDFADNYYSHDVLTNAYTEPRLEHAFNVDVSYLDPEQLLGWSSHDWPYRYYLTTILNGGSFPNSNDPHGYKLSLEHGFANDGTWRNPADFYPLGHSAIATPYAEPLLRTVQVGPAIDFAQIASRAGGDGDATIVGDTAVGFITASTVWQRSLIEIAGPSNVLMLHADFSSLAGAKGRLSIYLDNSPIGQIDEFFALDGNHEYAFGMESILAGYHELAFRLDKYIGGGQAAVTIDDIHMSYVLLAVPEPSSIVPLATGYFLVALIAFKTRHARHKPSPQCRYCRVSRLRQ